MATEEYPFLTGIRTSETQNLPPFKEYAWDFDKNCFIYDGDGNHILLEGNEAIKMWIKKALRTQRFSYLAYTWRYGMDAYKFIGKVLGVKERRSELRREIIESLQVNPYIKAINKIEFVEKGQGLEINIELETIYGALTL